MHEFTEARKCYRAARQLYYSHIYDEKEEALRTPNPNTTPFNHYFLTDSFGNILEVDTRSVKEGEKHGMSSPLGTLDLFGGVQPAYRLRISFLRTFVLFDWVCRLGIYRLNNFTTIDHQQQSYSCTACTIWTICMSDCYRHPVSWQVAELLFMDSSAPHW